MLVSFLFFGSSEIPTNFPAESSTAKTHIVYIGTYTQEEGHVDGKGAGVYSVKQNVEDGELELGDVQAEITNPSYLTVSPDGNYLYSVSEIGGDDGPNGFVYSYKIKNDGSLKELSQLETNGAYPCQVSTDSKGRFVFVANYMGGIDMYESNDGILTSTDKVTFKGSTSHPRQKESHPHMVSVSPDDKFLYVPDLGSNKVWIMQIDDIAEKLIPNSAQRFVELQQHAGPRHMAFNPVSGDVYVVSELDNMLNVYSRNVKTGVLTFKQSLPTVTDEDFDGNNSCADIHVHPSGWYLYVSNRGFNTISKFNINGDSGELKFSKHTPTLGEVPRNFTIDPRGKNLYVANQNSDNIVQFDIEPMSGKLTFKHEMEVPTPVCITFR